MNDDPSPDSDALWDPFTLACQSVLAHDMGHQISRISHEAAYARELIERGSSQRHDPKDMLDRIIESARHLHVMLRKHYQYQKDSFPEPCDLLEDVITPSIYLAGSLAGGQKNSFQPEVSDSMNRLPRVRIPKYRAQVAISKIIWIHFVNVWKSHDTVVAIDGTSLPENVAVKLTVSPTHLYLQPGEDIFAIDLDHAGSLRTVQRFFESVQGSIHATVAQIDDLYRSVEFQIRFPVDRDNDPVHR